MITGFRRRENASPRQSGVYNRRMTARFSRRVPPGDTHERLVCDQCEFVAYENPKLVVGAVCQWEGKVLLCRRDIEPRRGFWTLPAGYLELSETPEQGAKREVREEACADVELDALLGCYSIARISQVLLIYRGSLRRPEFAAGDETSEAALFAPPDIPWEELAFPSVARALRDWISVRQTRVFAPFATPENEVSQELPETGPLPNLSAIEPSAGTTDVDVRL